MPSRCRRPAPAPGVLALRCAGQDWTFAELLADAGALGATLAGGPGPLVVSGSSLDLAHHAYACSLENWPFWPVDRNGSIHWNGELAPSVALVIAITRSNGEPHVTTLSDTSLDAATAAGLTPAVGRWAEAIPGRQEDRIRAGWIALRRQMPRVE